MNPGPPATPAIPLSVAQEGLYYHCAMNPRGLAYHEVVSLRRDGPLDGAALEAALAEVVGRHDSLRSCFPTAGGSPVLRINEHRPAPLLALDLSSLSGREAASRAATVVADLARAPYALDRGPLLRPLLVHFPGEHHRLYLAMHHLIFDGVSLSRVLLPDLAALYEARRKGHHLPLAPAPSYADYARWQQDWMEGERAQRRLAYWRHHLSEVPPGPLPWDRDRREGAKEGAGAVPVSVDAATAGRLGEVAGHAGASFFQVVAATWALLLARYAGSGAAVFATAADLRQRAAFDNLVGYCLTPIPLRVVVAEEATVADLVGAVRDELLDALDHAVPFERIVRDLPPPAAGAGNPLYQTMLVMEPPGGAAVDGWSLHLVDADIGDAVGAAHGLDLELQLDHRDDGAVAGRLIYDADLFERATAQRIARHWTSIVRQVADSGTDLAVAAVDPLGQAERRLLVVEWNATALAPASALAAAAALAPATALAAGAGEGGDEGDGDHQGGTPALWLATLMGLGPDDTVATLPSASRRFPMLAEAMAGAVGAQVVEVPAAAEHDGSRLSRFISGERVSVVVARPGAWAELVASGLRGARGLRAVSIGAPLGTELAAALLSRMRGLWNAYGPAGRAECVAAGRVEDPACITVGRPLAGARLYVVDRSNRPAPIGTWGRLLAGGPGVAGGLGVAGAPGAGPAAGGREAGEAEPDPFRAGWVVATGDRARWRPDGRLQVAAG